MTQLDLETKKSAHTGIKGFLERFMRKYNTLMHILLLLPLYFLACIFLGICIAPAVLFFRYLAEFTVGQNMIIQNLIYGVAISTGYFIYGFTLLIVAPTVNFLLRTNLKEWRGPYYSLEMIKWYIHNGLTMFVRFTFLEFATPTPMGQLFYKMMGMKIGRGTTINTTHITDPSLIELGEKVTLGGSVGLLAHYGQGGLMVISPIKIGNKCTIGLKATIMGGCVIGDEAKLLPHSVVLPKTVIPPGETWGGVPAKKIEH